MPNKNSFWENLLKAGAIIGGAWLTIEVLKSISKKKTVYDCPKCGNDIEFNQSQCNLCKTELDWSNVTNE